LKNFLSQSRQDAKKNNVSGLLGELSALARVLSLIWAGRSGEAVLAMPVFWFFFQ
jgi:hypothetical protein